MKSLSWLRGGDRRAKLHANRPGAWQRSVRLGFETLESRALLTTFIVNTTSDNALDLAGTVDGSLSLREAITAANTNVAFGDAAAGSVSGDTIRFAATLVGQTIALGNGQLTISDDLTIDGTTIGVIVDAVVASRIFDVTTPEAVTLANLTLQNGSVAGEGGAIAFTGGGNKTLRGMKIFDSTASGLGGGAIFNASSNLTIQNSVLSGNVASGAAGGGGALLTQAGNVSISASEISANIANRAGGGIEIVNGSLSLSNVTLGGDLAAEGNIAGPTGTASPGNGGGVHVSGTAGTRTTVVGGTVQNNVAALEGGGLWNQSGSIMEVRNARIIDNVASGDAANDGGGGIFNNGGTLTVTSAVISNNSADGTLGSGGGLFTIGGNVNVLSSVISGNVANRAGGGIEIVNGSLTLNNVTLGGATASAGNIAGPAGSASPGNGGGLHVSGTAGTRTLIIGGAVQNNFAALEGGGLWNQSGSSMEVRGTTIANNTASGNAADDGGGGIFNNGGTLTVRGATIASNIANGTLGSGGGVLTTAGNVLIVSSTIRSNVANRAGGGIEIINGSLRLENVTLGGVTAAAGNVAGPAGAASPGNGGGLHVSGTSNTQTVIIGGVVRYNVAALEGGGLWNQSGSRLEVRGATIANNTAFGAAADDGGGGIFDNGGTLLVSNTYITANTASSRGGGIFVRAGGNATLQLVTMENNVAFGDGGAIFNGAVLLVANTRVQSNRAHGAGGGIFTDAGGVTTLQTANISSNQSVIGSANFGGPGTVN